MAIVGFSFSKLNGEKKLQAISGSIEINHNISVVNVEKTSLNIGSSKNEVLKIEFDFSVNYGSGLGTIQLVGEVIYSDMAEIINETLKGWKADKVLNKMVNEQVLGFVYSKAIVKALELSDVLGLPAPIPMPKVNFDRINKGNTKNSKKK